MPSFLNIPRETIAFILGFLAATVFWWLAGRLRAGMPQLIGWARQKIRAGRRKSQDKVDEYLRRETLRKAQGMHLAAPLFSLDEVLVPPALIAPPAVLLKEGAGAPATITGQVIPYLPDWPELASPYPVATFSLAEAMQNGLNVIVMGRPGSGKTVALAALASQMARKDAALGALSQSVPVLLHALDLPLQADANDPLTGLIQFVLSKSSLLMQRQIPAFLRATAQDGRLVLLLDGVDELPPEQVKRVAVYLETLIQKVPKIQVAVAAAPDCLGGLAKPGYLPLAVVGWKQAQVHQFVKQWGDLWKAHIAPEIARLDPKAPAQVDTRLLDAWLLAEWGIFTPFEWTMRVWGLYAGDLSGPASLDAQDAYVRRMTGNAVPDEALACLATEFLAQKQTGLAYNHLEHVLAKYQVHPRDSMADSATGPKPGDKPRQKPAGRAEQKVSSGGAILDLLLSSGLLVEHPGSILRLANPVLTGDMASRADSEQSLSLDQPVWSVAATAAKALAARGHGQIFVQVLLDGKEDPLYSRLLLAASWLSAAPASAEWRPAVLRRMLQLVQQDSVPLTARARLVAAFACSNDPSNALLFKQLLESPSAPVRQLAALGSGMIHSPKLIPELTGLLADASPDVRAAACLALAAYGGKTAAEIIPQVFLHGDETLQLAAAEALAGDAAGQEILKNALGLDNLMVRRAAVLALAQVREPWVLKLLEKVAVEDAQWAVRSVAGQALETLQKPNESLPAPQPDLSEAGWLIAFAGRQGVGIIPGQVPVDLLLKALQEGSLDEKLAALIYLKDHPDWPVTQAISRAACAEPPLLGDAGQYALWYLQTAGIELPAAASIY